MREMATQLTLLPPRSQGQMLFFLYCLQTPGQQLLDQICLPQPPSSTNCTETHQPSHNYHHLQDPSLHNYNRPMDGSYKFQGGETVKALAYADHLCIIGPPKRTSST